MIRLRVTIEKALHRRWLGLFVVLLLALLIVFVLIHDAEHALEDAAAMCLALAVIFSRLMVFPPVARVGLRCANSGLGRAPPVARLALVTSAPLNSVPLRR